MATSFPRTSAVPSSPVDPPATAAAQLQYERACDAARKLEAALPMLTSEEVHLDHAGEEPLCEWTYRFHTRGWEMPADVSAAFIRAAWLTSDRPLNVPAAIAQLRKADEVFERPLESVEELATRSGKMHAFITLALRLLGAEQ